MDGLTDPTRVRVVFFDAVGTLIHPAPPVGEVYARIARRWGAALDAAEAARRFRTAFQRQEDRDRASAYRTSEEREEERWRTIVAEVLSDQPDADGPFRELWDHFARADAWACYPDVAPCLDALHARGLALGIASNCDRRLRAVVAGLPALHLCTLLVISSAVGWRKPAPAFFQALPELAGCRPAEVLLVGDDWANDYEGGRANGLQVVYLARAGAPPGRPALTSLTDLPHLLLPDPA